MDKIDLIKIISVFEVFISLLLVLFLFTVKTKHRLSNRLFGFFILLNAVDISSWLTGEFVQHFPGLFMFRTTVLFFINPLFYLYVLSVCYLDFKLKAQHLWHALPFVLSNLVMMPRFYLASKIAKIDFFENYRDMAEVKFSTILSHLQFVFYLVGIFLVLKNYRKIYLENYAATNSRTYQWLFELTVVITIIHAIVVITTLIPLTSYSYIVRYAQILVSVNAVIILCWFVLKALYNPDLFRGVDSRLRPVEILMAEQVRPGAANANSMNKEIQEKIHQLKAYMTEQEPYLEPSLTIQDLAKQMNMSAKELSILINHHLHQHFFDFVNEYRIQKAMKILKDPHRQALTILEVLYEVGFNSKSSFNTAFKKYSDLTPTQYRNH